MVFARLRTRHDEVDARTLPCTRLGIEDAIRVLHELAAEVVVARREVAGQGTTGQCCERPRVTHETARALWRVRDRLFVAMGGRIG
jgi:hypothetical protein